MDNKKKILITYATAGVGHKKAALAINEALKNKSRDAEVRLMDVLDHTPVYFKRAYPGAYLFMVNRAILLWAFFYYFLDFKIIHKLLYPFRVMSHVMNGKHIIEEVVEYRPDVIVSTHFLMPDVCHYIKKRYKLNFKLICVITDYRAHSFWISKTIDTYIVAYEKTKNDLVKKWGVDSDNIKVMGIPTEPKFSKPHGRMSLRNRMGILPDSFVVLLLGGGYGVGPFLQILHLLNQLKSSITVITVCGHNDRLYSQIEYLKKNTKHNIINFGYTDSVDELMAVSDIYVGKPGGMSSTEAINQELPMILIRPIPGQEKRNANLIVESGSAVIIKKIDGIVPLLNSMIEDPKKISDFKNNIKKIKRPDAALDIADYILQI